MGVKTISASEAKQLQEQGAIIVDICSGDEYKNKHIAHSRSIPIDELKNQTLPENQVVIFSCLSGLRTKNNADVLQQCACSCSEIYLLEGGLRAWEKAGLPIEEREGGAVLDIMRQVQIVAGSLILLGAVLGWLVSPWFFLICAFVGAGLLFAGITGFCGMAVLSMKMPWNRI